LAASIRECSYPFPFFLRSRQIYRRLFIVVDIYILDARLRVSPYCAGVEKDVGLLIPLCDTAWMIKAEDTGDYLLSGVLTVERHGVTKPAGSCKRKTGAITDESLCRLVRRTSFIGAFVGHC
jgi:hypothetical protein